MVAPLSRLSQYLLQNVPATKIRFSSQSDALSRLTNKLGDYAGSNGWVTPEQVRTKVNDYFEHRFNGENQDWIYLSYGLYLPTQNHGRLGDSAERIQQILDDTLIWMSKNPLNFFLCYKGLCVSYLCCDTDHFLTHRSKNGSLNTLALFLKNHHDRFQELTTKLRKRTVHNKLHSWFEEDFWKNYSGKPVFDSNRLDIELADFKYRDNSWIEPATVYLNMQHWCNLQGTQWIEENLTAIQETLQTREKTAALCARLLLNTYLSHSPPKAPTIALFKLIISCSGCFPMPAAKDPWLWMNRSSYSRVKNWFAENMLNQFFGLPDHSTTVLRRKNAFWLKHADQIDDLYVVIDHGSGLVDSVKLLDLAHIAKGRHHVVSGSDNEPVHTLVMKFKDVAVIENINTNLPCRLVAITDTTGIDELLSKDSLLVLRHRDGAILNWETRFERQLSRFISGFEHRN